MDNHLRESEKALQDAGSPGTNIDPGQLSQRLGYVLRRAQIAVFADFFDAFAAYSIKPAQYSVLTIIGCNPGLSQSQVAETLGIKKPNFVAMIKTLETRGLAKRVATRTDRRANALYLTESGLTLMQKLHRIAEERENRFREKIGQADYDALYAPLQKLADLHQE